MDYREVKEILKKHAQRPSNTWVTSSKSNNTAKNSKKVGAENNESE